jgi:hypothetical protein
MLTFECQHENVEINFCTCGKPTSSMESHFIQFIYYYALLKRILFRPFSR